MRILFAFAFAADILFAANKSLFCELRMRMRIEKFVFVSTPTCISGSCSLENKSVNSNFMLSRYVTPIAISCRPRVSPRFHAISCRPRVSPRFQAISCRPGVSPHISCLRPYNLAAFTLTPSQTTAQRETTKSPSLLAKNQS
ncbi:hypothetical protein V1521DRAFT_194893 [Lipomyces starkeyi]